MPFEVPIELSTTGEFVIPQSFSEQPLGRIGRYEVLGRMAMGGMAEILLAREKSSIGATRHLVVKLIKTNLEADADFDKLFMNEGRLALGLKHPNICHIYELGIDAGRRFIAMEYVHGQTLKNVLKRAAQRGAPVPTAVAVKVIALVADALDSAHRTRGDGVDVGVVHRDVSPHNIMIGYDGTVKLLDFGVAQKQGDRSEVGTGTVKGKFAYFAPEQSMNQPLDGRTDIFALGVCLWEVLTGKMLFKRNSDLETLKAVVEEPMPEPKTVGADVPAALVLVMQKALEKEPYRRYQTASLMEKALEEYLLDAREVVTTGRISDLMRDLFDEEIRRGPILDRSEEVAARLRPLHSIPPASASSSGGLSIPLILQYAEKQAAARAPEPPPEPEPAPKRPARLGLLALMVATFVTATWVVAAQPSWLGFESDDPALPRPVAGGPSIASSGEQPGTEPSGDTGATGEAAQPENAAADEGATAAQRDAGAGGATDITAEGETTTGGPVRPRTKRRVIKRTNDGLLAEPDF